LEAKSKLRIENTLVVQLGFCAEVKRESIAISVNMYVFFSYGIELALCGVGDSEK
jgi:hypothetical protein